jgi:hypothetical protein
MGKAILIAAMMAFGVGGLVGYTYGTEHPGKPGVDTSTNARLQGFCEALTGKPGCAYADLPVCDVEDYPSVLPCYRSNRQQRITLYTRYPCPQGLILPAEARCILGVKR